MSFKQTVKELFDKMEDDETVADYVELFGEDIAPMVCVVRHGISAHMNGLAVALYMVAKAMSMESWQKNGVAQDEHQLWAMIADYGNVNESPMWGNLNSRWKNAVRVLARIMREGLEETMDVERLGDHLARGFDSLVIRDMRDAMAHYDRTNNGVIPKPVLEKIVSMINGKITHAEFVEEATGMGVTLSQAPKDREVFCLARRRGDRMVIVLNNLDEKTAAWLDNTLDVGLAIGRGANRIVATRKSMQGAQK